MQEVARCKKCGRGFVTLPAKWPARDPYWPQGILRSQWHTAKPCDGEIELVKVPPHNGELTREDQS